MCDYVGGEILFSFPNLPGVAEMMLDWFGEHGREAHLVIEERLDERLADVEVPVEARIDAPTQLWRIAVPVGQEWFKANFLRRAYHGELFSRPPAGWEDHTLQLFLNVTVGPNHLLTLNADAATGDHVHLTDYHERYRSMIGVNDLPSSADGAGVVVALVDSGLDTSFSGSVVRRVDLVTPARFGVAAEGSAVDGPKHGTAIATIISDIAPGAAFMVYRVADEAGRASEWDVVAALLSLGDADVVNLSVAFGLGRGDCPQCGRAANSARSMVFEQHLDLLLGSDDPPIVVAAAGNTSKGVMSYPARFSNVVAIGSITSARRVSAFSNFGARDHLNQPHPMLWFLPGGETLEGAQEAAATYGRAPFAGTSISCAYASGMIAALCAALPTDAVRTSLAAAGGEPVVDFEPHEHGHGLMTAGALT